MRLIDADALKEAIEKNACRHSHYYDVFDVIDDAPTIEPFEKIGAICNENCGGYRPKGKWIEHEDERWGGIWYTCSNCNQNATYEQDTYNIWRQKLSNFCPNCGTPMEVEND